MKKIYLYIITFLFATYLCAETFRVTQDANIREQPSTDSKVVKIVEKDTSLYGKVLDDNQWCEIKFEGETRYISKSVVEIEKVKTESTLEEKVNKYFFEFMMMVFLFIIVFVIVFLIIFIKLFLNRIYNKFLAVLVGILVGLVTGVVAAIGLSLLLIRFWEVVVEILKFIIAGFVLVGFLLYALNDWLTKNGSNQKTSGPKIKMPVTQQPKQQKQNYYCMNCGEKFSSIKTLTNNWCLKAPGGRGKHVLYEGSEKSTYFCKYCGKKYSSILSLTDGWCLKHPDGRGYHSPAL